MKILVTGAEGQLGSDIISNIKKHEVIGFGKEQLDITDKNSIEASFCKTRPEIVINCAAYTNVDGAESNPNLAYSVNAKGPENLSQACKKFGSKLIHISTDFVFNGGKRHPYTEEDIPNPISLYGKSKLEGERLIQENIENYFIIRSSWLFGSVGKNFVKTMLELAKTKDSLSVVNDQVGSPTYAFDLTYAINSLLASEEYGIYNITNSGSCSWFDFAKTIFEIAEKNTIVNPITSEELGRPAKRPAYSVLSNKKFQNEFGFILRPWEEGLKEFLRKH